MSIPALLLSLCLQAAAPELPPAQDPPKTDEVPLEVYFKDGLRFRSKDGAFDGRIGGRFIGHYRTIFDRPDDEPDAPPDTERRTIPNAFFVRQIRFESEGVYRKEWGYKVQVDFLTGQYNQPAGTGPSNVTGTLRDGFLEWRKHPEFIVRLGQYFEPGSQEDMSSTRFIDFTERSVMNRLLPGREIGLEAYGSVLENRLTYFLMVSNGNALLNDQGRSVTDSNDEKELAGLVHVRPFAATDEDLLKGLRLTLGGTVTDQDDVPSVGFDLISTELSILYLDSEAGGPAIDGLRWRLIPQFGWPIGPFCVRGEYLYREDELADGAPEDEIVSRAWYASASYIVTGENKVLDDRIVPEGEWGAVELLLRYAHLKVDHVFDAGLAPRAGNSDEVSVVTGGVNWWVTRNVRLALNVIREEYADELFFDQRTQDSFWGLIFRGQVDF